MKTLIDLGFDLGTTVTKVAALTDGGGLALSRSVPTQWRELGEGRFERDPAAVIDDVENLLADVVESLGRDTRVRSIGFTSMAEAGVLVDSQGHDHCPVIVWHDPRGSDQAAELPDGFAREFSTRTGLPVTHVASLFKLAWMRGAGLDLRGLQWLSLPEYAISRLGGNRVAELSLLGRTGLLDVHTNRTWLPAFDYLGVDTTLVPRIVAAGQPAGYVRSDHPVAGARGAVLTVAGHDHAVAAAATGCGPVGSTLDSFGTAEAYVTSAAQVPGPETVYELCTHGVSVYPHVVRGTTALIAGTRTGLVLKRVQRILGAEDNPVRDDVDRAARAIPPGSVTDVKISGYAMKDHEVSISLASDRHTPAEVWRAAIDGGTDAGSLLLNLLRNNGVPVNRIVVAGGWSRMSSVMEARRQLADVVEAAQLAEPGTHGAARFGRWAAGPGARQATDGRPPATWFEDRHHQCQKPLPQPANSVTTS